MASGRQEALPLNFMLLAPQEPFDSGPDAHPRMLAPLEGCRMFNLNAARYTLPIRLSAGYESLDSSPRVPREDPKCTLCIVSNCSPRAHKDEGPEEPQNRTSRKLLTH